MPLKSKAQEKFLWAKHPKIAEEFEEATPEGKKLPEHVKKMAKGGVVTDEARSLADLAASGMELGADPEAMQAGLDEKAKDRQDALDLSDLAASGMPLAADPDMLEAGLREAREGAHGYANGGEVMDEKDPAEIPDDVREYIEKAHKTIRESRPDEGWRIKSAEKTDQVAPYKQDEDAEADKMLPHYDDGGQVPDPNAILQDIAPPGTGALAPSPSPMAPMAPPNPPPMAPPSPMASASGAPVANKPPVAPALTDQDFMGRANKMLGLNPDQQAGFMKLLGQNAQKGQIGAGIAGIGDAIASGGTLGKVNPGALNKSEELIQGRTKEGLEGLQSIREGQGKAFEVADKLEARDPKSPLSKWAQQAYGPVGKKIGLDLNNASAALIGDVTGKGVEALNTEYQAQLKTMGLDLQKKQVEATIGNQKAERDISRQGQQLQATEKLGSRTIGNKLEGIIPGTPANTERKSLERIAAGPGETGPYGAETVRNGKTYEWSPDTKKYHLKQ